MNFSTDDQEFLTRCCRLQIKEKTEASTTARCDKLRSLAGHLEYARAANMLDANAVAPLIRQYTESYSCLVDVPEEEGGVDNYAENVLALTSGKKNESKAWTTSLNKENIMQLDCVKAFIQESKVARGLHFPEDRDKEVLPLKKKQPQEPIESPYNFKSTTTQAGKQPLFKPQHHEGLQARESGNKSLNNMKPVGANCQPPVSSTMVPPPDSRDPSLACRQRGGDIFGGRISSVAQQRMDRPESKPAGPNGYPSTYNSRQQMQPSNTVTQKPYGQFSSDRAAPSYKKPVKRPCREMEDESEEDMQAPPVRAFRTAGEQLAINNQKKYGGGRGAANSGQNYGGGHVSTSAYGSQKRSLGTRRGLNSKFVPPVMREENEECGNLMRKSGPHRGESGSEEPVDERLKNIEPKMIELINSEIMDNGPEIAWTDIAGLEFAKKTIKEIVVWPMLRPDIFTGLRGPPKGLLLFGPPGTGKTLIGKCIASQSKSTFFSISASSLTSKWVGEGEKMVRALFAVARVHQPSVVFIDEIDSLLSQRSDGENEGSRRIKTEFLVQLDGAGTASEDRILVVGATNRPQEIDEAARRRFVKRLYIPLPEMLARRQIVVNLMQTQKNELTDTEIDKISNDTDGYSGADMANLCREAALGPIRSVPFEEIENISADQVRPIVYADFEEAIEHVKPSVSERDLDSYLDWNKQYGSWGKS